RFEVRWELYGGGLQKGFAPILFEHARKFRVLVEEFFNQRTRIGAGFTRSVNGPQVGHHGACNFHGFSSLSCRKFLSLNRARWIFTFTATTERSSAAAISSWDIPSWARISSAARSASGRFWSAARTAVSSIRWPTISSGPGPRSRSPRSSTARRESFLSNS